jgi:hypothetical protein
MESFFFNPATMATGAGLVAAPVLIHLINRMRFRRIKWAAMEFLLKAQKKMRRRKILEQLLLLFLRMLLVFLVGVLFARYLGIDPLVHKETRPTIHIVVLDDTPSMADIGQAGESTADAFAEAKKMITEKILPAVSEASTPQRLRILRLSDQADLANDDPNKEPLLIRADSIESMRGKLNGEQPSTIHVSLVTGLKKVQELLDKAPADTTKVVHIVSDLRNVDWTEDNEGIAQSIKQMMESNSTKVHIVDVASPIRKVDRKTPAFSDNVAITEFKPKNRVVPKDRDVEFEIRVKNFGNSDLKDIQVQFYLNGQGNVIPFLPIDNLAAGQERVGKFQQKFSLPDTKDDLARFNVVTAFLTNVGSDGLAADNVRHAVVEVREKLNVLFVVNSDDKPDDVNGDSFYLRRLFSTNFAAIKVDTGDATALEKLDLRQYSGIYLLNIPDLKKGQTEKLERYIREGGGVSIFLGPKVLPESYNDLLYRGGEGFFPVPLPATGPTQPLTEEQKEKRRKVFAKKILVRDESVKEHPAVAGIYTNIDGKPNKDMEGFFLFPLIDQHWPIARLGKWRDDTSVREIYCLPNERPMKDYEGQAVAAIDAIKAKYGEPKFEKYRPTVAPLLEKIRKLASEDQPLSELVFPFDELLADQINVGDAAEALLREFWTHPELADAKKLCQALRDACKYGDPLYFAKKFGKGRVTAMMIPVESPWSDWPNGIGRTCWVAVVAEMQKYITGGGSEENRSAGSKFSMPLEPDRYKPTANVTFLSAEAPKPGTLPQRLPVIREPKQGDTGNPHPLDMKDGGISLNFSDAKKPGVYVFALSWQKRDSDPIGTPAEKTEYIAEAFNIDAVREGDLRRTNADQFKTTAKGADLHSSEDLSWLEGLKQKQTDLSSGRWIYLLILLTLIFEQAMAVRLSYHTRPENLEAYAPSAAAVFAHGTPPPVMSEAPVGSSAADETG